MHLASAVVLQDRAPAPWRERGIKGKKKQKHLQLFHVLCLFTWTERLSRYNRSASNKRQHNTHVVTLGDKKVFHEVSELDRNNTLCKDEKPLWNFLLVLLWMIHELSPKALFPSFSPFPERLLSCFSFPQTARKLNVKNERLENYIILSKGQSWMCPIVCWERTKFLQIGKKHFVIMHYHAALGVTAPNLHTYYTIWSFTIHKHLKPFYILTKYCCRELSGFPNKLGPVGNSE